METRVICPGCGAGFRLDPTRIPAEGARLVCPACGRKWRVSAKPGEAPAADAPVPSPTAQTTAKGDETTCPRCGHVFDRTAKVARRSVLVVDDQEFFRNFAAEILAGDYRILVAKNVDEAVRSAEEHRPDVIVLDLGLEGGADDGKRVLARLEHRFPVVILTGRTDFDLYGGDWRELEALGARGLVIKGLAMEAELKAKVESVLASA